ncbi:MAG: UvrB/UvrC motif-containing protein [Clostridiales bacterium]|nr:UvrB/UvrC motif-containing protein [Clostridiales bacterium]
MKCQHCNKNEATVYIKKNINGQIEEMHLCSECAKELGVMDEFKFPSMSEMFGDSLLGNFLGAGVAAMNSLSGIDRCASCGSSFNDIVNSGRIGCADCYDKFADKLEPSIRKIYGKTKHIGKFVSYTDTAEDEKNGDAADSQKVNQPKAETVQSLQAQLDAAVKEQRYEDAAVIRDKIKEMQEDKNE